MGDSSKEQDKGFNQDVKSNALKASKMENMMGGNIWHLVQESNLRGIGSDTRKLHFHLIVS